MVAECILLKKETIFFVLLFCSYRNTSGSLRSNTMNALPKMGWGCVEKQNIESLTVSIGCKFYICSNILIAR